MNTKLRKFISSILLVVFCFTLSSPIFAKTYTGNGVSATETSITINGNTWYAIDPSAEGTLIQVKPANSSSTYQFKVSNTDLAAINQAYTEAESKANVDVMNRTSQDILEKSRQDVSNISNVMSHLAPNIAEGQALINETPIDKLFKTILNVVVYATLAMLVLSVIVNGACLISGVYEIITGETPQGSTGGYSNTQNNSVF